MQKSTLTWVAWNAVFAVAIYVGIWSDVPYVGYGVSAFVWLMLGLYLLVLYPGDATKLRERPIPWPVSVVFDVAAIYVFLERGWFVTATAYALAVLALTLIYGRSQPRKTASG